MAIKDGYQRWAGSKPGQAMALVAAVGVVIGAVLGAGAGFKIEQSRTRSDVKRLQNELKLASAQTGLVLGSIGQRVGKVTTTTADTLTLSTKLTGTQVVHTTSATQFEKAVAGKTSDIVVGARVLVTISGSQVIVLPTGSKLGRQVTKVGTDAFTITKANGKGVASLKLANVKEVDTITSSKISDITTGSGVLVGGRATTGHAFSAVEVILLGPNSPFAA